jgi:SGNH hydrolase-like domain, acetyltransferase AlgX
LAQQHQTPCVILFLPSKEEVYLPLLGEQAADLARPFMAALTQRGIAALDLGPYFRARAAAGERLFFEMDGHPTAQGHALIAEVVGAYLNTHALPLGAGGESSFR